MARTKPRSTRRGICFGRAGHSARGDGLDPRRRRIWWTRTFTGDVNVERSSARGRNGGLNRVRRLRDESGRPDQRLEDGSAGAVRSLHRTPGRLPARLVMHRAHGRLAMAVTARAFLRMRIRSTEPHRDRYERHRPDLAEQPDRRERREHPAQMWHYQNTLAPVSWTCQTAFLLGRGASPRPTPHRRRSRGHSRRWGSYGGASRELFAPVKSPEKSLRMSLQSVRRASAPA